MRQRSVLACGTCTDPAKHLQGSWPEVRNESAVATLYCQYEVLVRGTQWESQGTRCAKASAQAYNSATLWRQQSALFFLLLEISKGALQPSSLCGQCCWICCPGRGAGCAPQVHGVDLGSEVLTGLTSSLTQTSLPSPWNRFHRTGLAGRPTWVAAHVQPEEEAHMARVHIRLAAKLPRLRTVIVPADASRGKELGRLLRQEHGLEVDEWEGPHAKCEGMRAAAGRLITHLLPATSGRGHTWSVRAGRGA